MQGAGTGEAPAAPGEASARHHQAPVTHQPTWTGHDASSRLLGSWCFVLGAWWCLPIDQGACWMMHDSLGTTQAPPGASTKHRTSTARHHDAPRRTSYAWCWVLGAGCWVLDAWCMEGMHDSPSTNLCIGEAPARAPGKHRTNIFMHRRGTTTHQHAPGAWCFLPCTNLGSQDHLSTMAPKHGSRDHF
jgi:hypothetical protein